VKRVLSAAATLGIGALVLTGCASSPTVSTASGGPGPIGITAHGTGTVTGTPDELTIQLGVQTRADTAAAALAANNQQANNLINTLKSKGVADADLQTSQLSVDQSYDPTNTRITGYQVSNQVTVTLHHVADAGDIIDAAGRAAGDAIRVQQLSFTIADESALRAKARADAVKRAKAQAAQMARAAGVHLGKLLSITEAPAAQPPGPLYRHQALSDGAPQAPVQPGTDTLSVDVDVVYDIDQ